MIDWIPAQTRLGVKADGQAGPLTFTALLPAIAGNPVPLARELAAGMVAHAGAYGILDNTYRLAAFLAQTCHESGGFRYMQELGGSVYFARYDGRADLGNTHPGDGALYHGRGLIQLTGRANYREYGDALGIDLIAHPDLAVQPTMAVLVSLEYWKRHGLNALADNDDMLTITKRINGGTRGIQARMGYWKKAMGILE